MATKVALDGLEALKAQIGLKEIASLIERTARWVDPATFRLLPVWFPEHARGKPFYKANWSEPQTNTRRADGATAHKLEANIYASKALTLALGLRSKDRPNWSCCHIWSVDDVLFQTSNAVVQDRCFYSCVGNMVLLPTPLKAFTDSMPEIKAMLRICARNLYSWSCDHEGLDAIQTGLAAWDDWSASPSSWPKHPGERLPLGVVPLNEGIKAAAAARVRQIRNDLKHAGPFYPRDDVHRVLQYWDHIASGQVKRQERSGESDSVSV